MLDVDEINEQRFTDFKILGKEYLKKYKLNPRRKNKNKYDGINKIVY